MTRSNHTDKPPEIAQRLMPRDKHGEIIWPRIIEKKPRRGDIHPIDKSFLSHILRNIIPLEYVYGLTCVELRARESKQLDKPLGVYNRGDRVIRLFSLPMIWELHELPPSLRQSVVFHDATVHETEGKFIVKWPSWGRLSMWFYMSVLTHELGHHYRQQYRHRNKAYESRNHEEMVADLISDRLSKQLIEYLRAKDKPEQ